MRRGSTYHLSFIKTCLALPCPAPLAFKGPETSIYYSTVGTSVYCTLYGSVKTWFISFIHPFLPPPTYTDKLQNYYRLDMSFDVLPS